MASHATPARGVVALSYRGLGGIIGTRAAGQPLARVIMAAEVCHVPGCTSGRLCAVDGGPTWELADKCFGAAGAAPLAVGHHVCAVHLQLLRHMQRYNMPCSPPPGSHSTTLLPSCAQPHTNPIPLVEARLVAGSLGLGSAVARAPPTPLGATQMTRGTLGATGGRSGAQGCAAMLWHAGVSPTCNENTRGGMRSTAPPPCVRRRTPWTHSTRRWMPCVAVTRPSFEYIGIGPLLDLCGWTRKTRGHTTCFSGNGKAAVAPQG